MRDVQVFILAGGLGTRLSHIVKDVPKPMAPISGKPFLYYQIEWLRKQGFKDIVLLVGHKSEAIIDYFDDGKKFGVNIKYSIEDELLGTGGAVIKALSENPTENFVILNGDTFFDIDLVWFYNYFKDNNDSFDIALKYKEDVKRYGYVSIDDDYFIKEMIEKSSALEDGYINGGIYIGKYTILKDYKIERKSMETEIFPKLIRDDFIKAIPFGDKFIDIGIPEDYNYADQNLTKWIDQKKLPALFLDRDGVLIEDTGYVFKIEDAKFIDKTVKLVNNANKHGHKVIVVTNQAGVAKGKFGLDEVKKLNNYITEHYLKNGAVIDNFFICPFHEDGIVDAFKKKSLLRKPEPAMILLACDQYHLDLRNSLMIGDKDSDIIKLPYLESRLVQGRYEITDKLEISNFEDILS